MLRSLMSRHFRMWGGMLSRGGLSTRLSIRGDAGWPIDNRPQVVNLSHIVCLLLLCVSLLPAAIFPDQIGDFTKGAPKALAVPDQALYNEYGLVATEQAEYTSVGPAGGPGTGGGPAEAKRLTATAWRMRDST